MLMVALMPMMTSCGDDDTNETKKEFDRYYVRYEAVSKANRLSTSTCKVNYMTENGIQTVTHSHDYSQYGSTWNWEGQYGPFEKGDLAKLIITCSGASNEGRLYVSRNNEAFVVKAEGQNKDKLELEYTIDY